MSRPFDPEALAALSRLEDELERLADEQARQHAQVLQSVLALHRRLSEHGAQDLTDVNVALLLRCTEHRAQQLLRHARQVVALDAAFTIYDTWTVEQAAVVLDEVDGLAPELADAVVAAVLRGGRRAGTSEIRRVVRRERLRVAAEDAADQRKRATRSRSIQFVPGRDGQAGLWITGPAADIDRIMAVVRAASAPIGPEDERKADARRFDALLDLVTRRSGGGPISGEGSPTVVVLTPIATALEQSDEPGLRLGLHGPEPVDSAWVREQLTQDPILLRAPVDADGQPIAAPDLQRRPGWDRVAVQQALLELLAAPPPPASPAPRWPGGHHPPDPVAAPDVPGAHAAPYRVPPRMRRLLELRSPTCEWPGCSAPAGRCDVDHDLAWPAGPTCPCNLGPLSRRHHRTKQTGWTKTRHSDGGLTWTSPTGRRRHLPAQHQPPPAVTRPLPRLSHDHEEHGPGMDGFREYGEVAPDPHDLDAWLQRGYDDSSADDPDPDRQARLAADPFHDDSWGPRLDDPHLWIPDLRLDPCS